MNIKREYYNMMNLPELLDFVDSRKEDRTNLRKPWSAHETTTKIKTINGLKVATGTPPKKEIIKVWCADTKAHEDKSLCKKIGNSYHLKLTGKLGIRYSVYEKYGTVFVALYRKKKILDIITFASDIDRDTVYDRIFGNVSSFEHCISNPDKKYFKVKFESRILTEEDFNSFMEFNSWTNKAKQGTKNDVTISSIMNILSEDTYSIRFSSQSPHIAMGLAQSVSRQQRDKKKVDGSRQVQVCAFYPNFHSGSRMVTHNDMGNVLPLYYEYNRV